MSCCAPGTFPNRQQSVLSCHCRTRRCHLCTPPLFFHLKGACVPDGQHVLISCAVTSGQAELHAGGRTECFLGGSSSPHSQGKLLESYQFHRLGWWWPLVSPERECQARIYQQITPLGVSELQGPIKSLSTPSTWVSEPMVEVF